MATNKKTTGKRKTTTKQSANSRNTTTRKAPARKATPKENPFVREIVLLFVIVFGILALLSLFGLCGVFGEGLSYFLFGTIGIMAFIFPVYFVIATGLYLSNQKNKELRRKIIYSVGLFWSLCGMIQWFANDGTSMSDIYYICGENHSGGGVLGGLLSFQLGKVMGRAGTFIIILALFLVFFMLFSRKMIFSLMKQKYDERETERNYVQYEDTTVSPQRTMNTYKFEKEEKTEAPIKEKVAKKKKEKPSQETIIPEIPTQPQNMEEINIIRSEEICAVPETEIYKEELENKFGRKTKKTSTIKEGTSAPMPEPEVEKKPEKVVITKEDRKEMEKVQQELTKAAVTEIPYQFPSLDLLNRPKLSGKGMDNNELRSTAMKLQETLESFGVRVKMGDISLGPSVTRYELIPEQGVKVSRITGLSDDIKLSLAASDIRIEAPIPGKAAVGIEVPNPERTMITLRELLESGEFTKAKSKVTFAVGKDISGKTIVTDIAKMPHLLIAGATGSGKSVLINTLIMSIIYKANPNEVKMIMIDPKMVELTAYEDIPHLMIPVVKDPKKASAALAWAVAEMTQRYQKFADAGVRDIKSYNARIDKVTNKDDPEFQKMPQIVIIVDEFADLMMVAPGEVEDCVCRLAQLARAAGIHLVLATQRPSVNVITGLIKANIPSRIALSVSSAVDSRTIIDSAGAEKLLGNGDMLFAPQNLPKPIRVQGAFVSDEERDGVVNFLKNNGGPSYNDEVTKHIESAPVPGAKNGAGAVGGGAPEQDELFVEAGMFIIEKDKASIGLLQRMFRIGFNRAARIMDQLADAGVVGPEEGTKARQILMSKEQFENYLEENG